MNYVSFSQYNIWTTCPKQWKITYIDGLKLSEPNIHLIFGTALHITIQKYLEVYYLETKKAANDLNLNNILLNNMIKDIEVRKNEHLVDFVSQAELLEYYQDGVLILEWFKKHSSEYFNKKQFKLIGIELPLDLELQPGLKFIGKLDFVLKDIRNNNIKIIDFKKSYRGWKKSEKNSQTKRGQLQLYKQFYSEIYNIPTKNIDIEFMILKQKIFNHGNYPAKRIQVFSPPSSDITLKKVKAQFMNFVNTVFKDGEINRDIDYPAKPSKKNCQYCPFRNNKDLCPVGVNK